MSLIRSAKDASGATVIQTESVPGSGDLDVTLTSLPPDAQVARVGGRHRQAYTPEDTGVLDADQFGMAGKYFSPNYRFCIDNAAYKSVNQRRNSGENTFTRWGVVAAMANSNTIANVNIDWTSQLVVGEGRVYWTANELHEYQDNITFYTRPFSQFVTDVYPKLPALGYGTWEKYKYLSLNFETYYYCVPGQVNGSVYPGWEALGSGYFSNWDSEKNTVITLESVGGQKTLDQLAAEGRGGWDYEMQTRRANRYAFILEAIRHKANPAIGVKVDHGTSLNPFKPALEVYTSSGAWLDGWCKVSHIGGDAQGNITLSLPGGQQWNVKLDGDAYSHSDFLSLYYYRGIPNIGQPDFFMDPPDYDEIFNQHKAGTQNYPYLWSKIKPWGLVMEEFALYEIEHAKMMLRYGKTYPLWRMIEPQYESSVVCPFQANAPAAIYNDPNYQEVVRLLQPPWEQFSRVIISRLVAGDSVDSGFYVFPQDFQLMCKDPKLMVDPAGKKPYDLHLHAYTALHQARALMQRFETFWPGTTLTTPDVQINQTGSWQNYSAGQAYNWSTSGAKGAEKPAYKIRWKVVPGGWWVVVVGGFNQGWTTSRTDLLRMPGGGMNGNMLRVKTTGPVAHVFEFFIPSADSGQIFDCLPTPPASSEKPGYAGPILPATP